MNLSLRLLSILFLLATVNGCKRHDGHAHGGGHAHQAPHGGTLVELGDHAYNLEFVHDPAAGKLTAYVLDGHAENFIRIAVPSFDVNVTAGGERRTLTLRAVANPATGETVGNTSQFEAQADWLKTAANFDGNVVSVEIRGTKFSSVAFKLGKK